MNSLKTSVVPQFWKDWKQIHKKHKAKEYGTIYNNEDFICVSDETKIDSIAILGTIKNSIINSLIGNCLDGTSDPYDRQPFLSKGWQIRKKRWGIDNTGKRGGLRIIFCLSSTHLLFVYIATKNDCADERQLERVFMKRIETYLSL